MSDMEKSGRRRAAEQEEVNDEIETTEEEEDEGGDEARGLTPKKGRATIGRRNAPAVEEPEKRGLFTRIALYFQGVRAELDKVAWPTRAETVRLSWIVVGVLLATALFLGAVSFGFTQLFVEGLNNPLVFVIFGVIVAGVGYWFTRNNNKDNNDNSSFSSRL